MGSFNLCLSVMSFLSWSFNGWYWLGHHFLGARVGPQLNLHSCISSLLAIAGDIHPNPGPQNITFCHSNIRDLVVRTASDPNYKVDEIYSTLAIDQSFDFICLTETHLDDDIITADIPIPNSEYSIYRRDRNARGGGVCILATTKLVHRVIGDLSHPNLEVLWLEISAHNKIILLGVLYRPPDSNIDNVNSFIDNFNDNLDAMSRVKCDAMVILGDFNDRCTQWNSDHTTSDFRNKLRDLVNARGLHQCIETPTRITRNCSHILDLIITDSPGFVQNSSVKPPIANSDHCTIDCSLKITYTSDKPFKRKVYNYNNANFSELAKEISESPLCTLIHSVDDIDDSTQFLYDIVHDSIANHIPSSIITVRPKDKPWMNHVIRKSLRVRNRLHKKYKRTRTETDEERWKTSRSNTKLLIHEGKIKYHDSLYAKLENPNTAPKQYWRIAKSLYGAKLDSSIPAILENNCAYSTSVDKCEIFNKYFVEQTDLEVPLGHSLPDMEPETNLKLDSIETNETEVSSLLKKLNTNKASGPDNISNTVLKNCAESISRPLALLFNKSWQSTFTMENGERVPSIQKWR